jgi:hypothetical protein
MFPYRPFKYVGNSGKPCALSTVAETLLASPKNVRENCYLNWGAEKQKAGG